MHLKQAIVLSCALLLSGMAIAETGTALKADVMRSKPFADAKTTGKFVRGEKVEILGKQGAWLNIRTAGGRGWVRLLSVRRGTSSSASNARGVLDVASGRAGTGQVVATTGVRGLSAEELKSATFNPAEMQALEGHTQSSEQARQFASSGGLKAMRLSYLPATAAQGAGK